MSSAACAKRCETQNMRQIKEPPVHLAWAARSYSMKILKQICITLILIHYVHKDSENPCDWQALRWKINARSRRRRCDGINILWLPPRVQTIFVPFPSSSIFLTIVDVSECSIQSATSLALNQGYTGGCAAISLPFYLWTPQG